jgi:hypothetical protein
MTPNDRRSHDHVPQDLRDAATAHRIYNDIVEATGELAARPLDEHVAAEMRRVLERADDPDVRAAVRRLMQSSKRRPQPQRPHLRLVRGEED